MEDRGNRDRIFLSTKGGHPPFPTFPLAGASRVEHVEAMREARDAVLTEKQRDFLRRVT